jgi:hypothetical protein
MLSERRKAYFNKLPEVASDERLKEITRMYEQRDAIANEVKRIEDEADGFALVTDDEEDMVVVLDKVKNRLDRLGKATDVSDEEEKYKLLQGILYFKLQSEFVPRLWSVKNNLRELDRALEKTRQQKRSLVKAANEAPKYFEGYDQKIDWSKKRISNLLARLGSAINQQESYIQKLAMAGLTKRRQALENYHVRARFGIARLYDSLILEKDKQVGENKEGAMPADQTTNSPAPVLMQQAPAGTSQPVTQPPAEATQAPAQQSVLQVESVPAKAESAAPVPAASAPVPEQIEIPANLPVPVTEPGADIPEVRNAQ